MNAMRLPSAAAAPHRKPANRLAAALLIAAFVVAPMVLVPLSMLTGCAAFAAALPTVAEVVSDAVAIVGMIGNAVSSYFKANPGKAALQTQIEAAIQKTQAALVIGEQSLYGVKDITQGQMSAAFAQFAVAFGELMALLAPLGIVPAQPTQPVAVATVDAGGDAGALQAAPPPLLVVPTPICLRAWRSSK